MATKKYRINELLESLPLRDFKKALRVIPKQLAVSPATFNNYRSITVNDSQDIPHEKVLILEALFGLKSGELENFTVNAKPLQAIPDLDTTGTDLVTKFNLKR